MRKHCAALATTIVALAFPAAAAAKSYTVQSGDTLSGIAKANGVSLQALDNANGWDTSKWLIHPGDRVEVPSGSDPPAPQHHTTTHRSSPHRTSKSSGGGSSSGFSIPAYIVMCESRGNYSAVNSSTGAGGAYQIMPSTWRAYGGSGSPSTAPKSEQDAIAAKIYAAQGSAPWSCAR